MRKSISMTRLRLLERDIAKVFDNHSNNEEPNSNMEACKLYIERLFEDIYNEDYGRSQQMEYEIKTYDLRRA